MAASGGPLAAFCMPIDRRPGPQPARHANKAIKAIRGVMDKLTRVLPVGACCVVWAVRACTEARVAGDFRSSAGLLTERAAPAGLGLRFHPPPQWAPDGAFSYAPPQQR
jgi:hypothetical protein